MGFKTDFLLDLRNGLAAAETRIVKAQEEGIPQLCVLIEDKLSEAINEVDDVLDAARIVVRDLKVSVDAKLRN